jgi:malate/lactate dehydrogenase
MKISIIGAAGCIGSSTAFNIATQGLADELVLIGGSHQDSLKQYVLDLSTAISTENFTVRSGVLEDMIGSDIVIMSAGAPQGIVSSRMEWLSANLSLFQDIGKRIVQYCPESIIVTVTNPVDPFNYAMYLFNQNKDRRKFIGYSTNDTFRFRIMSAEELNVKPHRINGFVIGEHGESQVLVFSSLELDGQKIQIGEEFKQKIKARIPSILKTLESFKAKTGRTSGWTCAVGITAICRAIKLDSRVLIPCSSVLEGEYGARNLSMSVPAIIGKEGIHDVKILDLAVDEQEGVKKTISYLGPFMKRIEQSLDIVQD